MIKRYTIQVSGCWENLCDISDIISSLDEQKILKLLDRTTLKYVGIDEYIIEYDDKYYKFIKKALNRLSCKKHKNETEWYLIKKDKVEYW